jgi:hypothetical protein
VVVQFVGVVGSHILADIGWINPDSSSYIVYGITGILISWMALQTFRLSSSLIRCPRCMYLHTPGMVAKHGSCRTCSQQLLIVEPRSQSA